MPKRATRKGVTPAKRSPKRPTTKAPRAASPPPGPGRPSTYDPRYCREVIEYFTPGEPKFEIVGEGAKAKVVWTYPRVPLLEGFAAQIGVHRDTLNEWQRQHEEFSDAVKRAKCLQAQQLSNGAMLGYYNPTFAIFFAKNNMGWKDKVAVVGGDEGDRPIQEQVGLDDETKAAMARISLRMKTLAASRSR